VPVPAAVAVAVAGDDPVAALLGLADATSAAERRAVPTAATPAPAPAPAPAPPAAPAFSALYDRAVAIAAAAPEDVPVAAAAPAEAVLPATFAEFLAHRLADDEVAAPEPEPLVVLTDRAAVPEPVPAADVRVPVDRSRQPRPRRQARVRPAFADAPRLRRDELGRDAAADRPAAPMPPSSALAAALAPLLDEIAPPAAPAAAPPAPAPAPAVAPAVAPEIAPEPVATGHRGAVVVVGPAADARRAAAQLAADLLGDPAAVLVAQRDQPDVPAHQWLRTAADVEARRRGWSRRKAPVVVAVAVPPTADGPAWVGPMVVALQPAALHVVGAAGDGSAEQLDGRARRGPA
jgi:hypothetical protein